MDFLGIGPLELLFVVLIMILVLGPKDMVNTARTVGNFIRKVVSSDWWREIRGASQTISKLPNMLMDEAGLDQLQQDLEGSSQELRKIDIKTEDLGAWVAAEPAPKTSDEPEKISVEPAKGSSNTWVSPPAKGEDEELNGAPGGEQI